MLELLMLEWEDLLDNDEYKPVHHALRAGIALLEKYYCRADDTDVYFIAHGKSDSLVLSVVSHRHQCWILSSNVNTLMLLGMRSTLR